MKNKVLFEAKRFNVVENESKVGLDMKKVTVGVLPYVISDGLLSAVGVLHEHNVFRKGGFCNTIITGTVDPDDKDLLHTAIRELNKEGGFTVTDVNKWVFLGSMKLSKGSNEETHVYAVNVSETEQEEAHGDGSKQEELSTLKMTQINDAILTEESLFLASYLRLFDFFYQRNKS